MFDVASSEVILLGVVALLVIPPKDLPKAMRFAGHWLGKVRGVANQFRSGFDTMVREAELQDMEKKWAAENERIMREHPPESTHLPASHDAIDVGYDGTEGTAPPTMVETPALTATPRTAEPFGPAPQGATDAAPTHTATALPAAAEPVSKAHP
ncbi:Sec-independent protein translocase protein TatB [Sphingomonas sp. RB3P16]|uniref:Sec-independent protein translocase protein TatB n=1 Tax=Parasphingomonas frigoris TaxID=3096163 RepID=UPI002FCC481B